MWYGKHGLRYACDKHELQRWRWCRWVKLKQLQGHNESTDTVGWYSLLTHSHSEHDSTTATANVTLCLHYVGIHPGSSRWPVTTRGTSCASRHRVLTWPGAHGAGQAAATPLKVSSHCWTTGRGHAESTKSHTTPFLRRCCCLIPRLILIIIIFFVNKKDINQTTYVDKIFFFNELIGHHV